MSIANHKHASDLALRVFGRLTATNQAEKRGRNRMYWLCRCSCGREKWVIADALKSGATKSCGCLNDEVRRSLVHGESARDGGAASPTYNSWHSMKQRCTNPSDDRFSQYGGRGITVCERWMKFDNFLADMGEKPPRMSIDRIDNNGNYQPDNCRWANAAVQSRNTSRNRFFTFQGETLCLDDWSRKLNIPHTTLHTRLRKWPVERALTEPVRDH